MVRLCGYVLRHVPTWDIFVSGELGAGETTLKAAGSLSHNAQHDKI